MAQAHCLAISEILGIIFEHAFFVEHGYSSLAALARTCRAFSIPALSILWHTQPSLLHLVLTFPQELLDYDGPHDNVITVEFTKSPSLQDWKRPLIYVKLIKEIAGYRSQGHTSPKSYMINFRPNVVETLFDSCPALPLLPNLQSLDYNWITLLHLNASAETQDALEMASVHKLSSPAVLRSLTLPRRSHTSAHHRTLFQQVVQHHANIQSLKIIIVNDALEAYEYLSLIRSLQKLKSLVLSDMPCSRPPGLDPAPDMYIPFFEMLELELQCNIPSAFRVLKTIDSPELQKLYIRLRREEETAESSALCGFIASKSAWQASLRSITVTNCTLASDALMSLLTLKHLRFVVLEHTDLNDDMLEQMAISWPMLEHLSLEDNWCNFSDALCQRPTLCGLVSLAKHCPHLGDLRFRLDADPIPSHLNKIDVTIEKTRKRLRLCLRGPSRISDPVRVAELLLDLFPGITLIIPPGVWAGMLTGGPQWFEMWDRVAEIIDERRVE